MTLRNYQPVAWVLYQRVIDQSKADIFINPGIKKYASGFLEQYDYIICLFMHRVDITVFELLGPETITNPRSHGTRYSGEASISWYINGTHNEVLILNASYMNNYLRNLLWYLENTSSEQISGLKKA